MSIDTQYAVLRKIIEQVPSIRNTDQTIAEFGVYSGYSLALLSSSCPNASLHGFDSFEGLPEDWRPGFPAGSFGDKGILQYMPEVPENVTLHKGWFEETVGALFEPDIQPLALLHIDCDLYSSTVTALEASRHLLREGTLVVFDEYQGYPGWEDHEAKAWTEFCHRHGIVSMTAAQEGEERAFVISRIVGSQ